MSNTGPHCEVPNMHYIRSAPAIKHKIYRTCFLISIFCYSLHLFHASGLFLYLMREWGNQIFFDVFKEFSGMKWINILIDPFSLTFIYVLDIYGRMYHVYKMNVFMIENATYCFKFVWIVSQNTLSDFVWLCN